MSHDQIVSSPGFEPTPPELLDQQLNHNSLNLLAGDYHEWEIMGKKGPRTNRYNDQKKKMEMDRSYIEKAEQRHYPSDTWMEPCRNKKKRQTQTNMEKISQ